MKQKLEIKKDIKLHFSKEINDSIKEMLKEGENLIEKFKKLRAT